MSPILLLGLWALSSPQTQESPKETDPKEAGRILMRDALAASGLNSSATASGLSFVVPFDTPGGKTRNVYVAAAPTALLSLRCHLVYTQVWSGANQPPAPLVSGLLSTAKKLGGFYVYKDNSGMWSIRFGVSFDASALAARPNERDPSVLRLKDTIGFVNAVGGETEKAIADGKLG